MSHIIIYIYCYSFYSDLIGYIEFQFLIRLLCLHDEIINAAPRIGGKFNKSELYIQCPYRRVKDTHIKQLEKCECVSSVMTIAPILNIDREKMGAMGILLIIDDGVYVCICTVYSSVLKISHNMHLSTKLNFQQKRRVNDVVQSLIIDHMHPSVYWKKKI